MSECISTGLQNVSLVNIEVHIQALELAKDLFLIYIKQMMIWERRENITSNVKKQEKKKYFLKYFLTKRHDRRKKHFSDLRRIFHSILHNTGSHFHSVPLLHTQVMDYIPCQSS